MALTVQDFAVALNLSEDGSDLSDIQTSNLQRLLGVGEAFVTLLIPNAPEAVQETVILRLGGYLHDTGVGRRDGWANAWVNSGAGNLASRWQTQSVPGSSLVVPAGVPNTGGLDEAQVQALIAASLAAHGLVSDAHHVPPTVPDVDAVVQTHAADAGAHHDIPDLAFSVSAPDGDGIATLAYTFAGTSQDIGDFATTAGGGDGGSGEDNVQADWNEVDDQSDAYIQNKPAIPDLGNLAEQVDHLIDELLHESTTEAVTGVLGNSLTSLRYTLPTALEGITNVSVRVHLSVQRNSFVQWDTNERVRLTVEGGGALGTLIPETHYNLGQNINPNFHFVLNEAELTTGAKPITFTAEVVNAPSVEVHFISVTDLTYSSLTLRELPPYGDTGQILAKASPTSYDTEWIDNAGGGGGGQGTTLNHFRAPLTVQATAGLTTAAVNRTLITAAAIRENLGFTLNVAGDTLTFVNAGRYMVNVVQAFAGTGSSRDTVKLNLLPAADYGMVVGAAYYRGSPGALTGYISGAAIVNVAAGDTLQLGAFTETDTTNTYAFGGVDSHIEIQELPLTG